MGVIAIISIFKNPLELDKNIFFKFRTPEGRGDINKIKFNKKKY